MRAVEALEGPDASELVALRAAQATLAEKKKFKGIPKGATRSYQRVKSVPEKDLPESWRVRLEEIDARRFDGSIALADSLFDRMKRKLCEYIRFVRDEGLAKELTLEGLQPFFQYETTRISNRGVPPRPSTVVNTFNDLRKYMQLSGDYSSELVLEMTRLLEKLRDNAEGVTARKYAALARIDPKSILPKAQSILDNAGHLLNAAKRHIQRNRALATALPPMTPLRREWHGLAFGRDIVWLEDRYRFRDYKLRKTRHRRGRETYPGSVHPSVQHFVDAVLLQDEDPKYLAAFRERAEEEEWPLFAHPDGEPVSVNYVSQVWASILGTGAHIARSLIYDILFAISEDAARGGMILNDHQSRQAADRYIGVQARMAAYEAAARERDEIFEMYENDPTAGGFGSGTDH
ncbi:hypothetical protein NBRC116599_41760 [Aquicoccus sp. SU-CL01552]